MKEDQSIKKGLEVRIHPYKLISMVHKNSGLDKACEVAHSLIKKKYDRILEDSKGEK